LEKSFSIVSVGGQGNIKTLLLNNKTRNVGDLGIRTFAEKCSQNIFAEGIFCAVPKTLQQGFVYPDDWYKGKMYTEDLLVYKSISGTTTKVISYLENRPLSIVNLNITKNGIFFIDENTYSLYSLEL
jgi:5-keto 4-deoxyuronate isomerase